MTINIFVAALSLVLATTVGSAAERAAEDIGKTSSVVRSIGSVRQLFIDNYLIASLKNLKRNFHAAKKHGSPVMVPEHPWEGVGTAPCRASIFLVTLSGMRRRRFTRCGTPRPPRT